MACTFAYEDGVLVETQDVPSVKNYSVADLLEKKRLNLLSIDDANIKIASLVAQNSRIDILINKARDNGYHDGDNVGEPSAEAKFLNV